MADLLRLKDAERELGITRPTLRKYIRDGALEAVRLPGGHFRVPASALRRFKREHLIDGNGDAT